MTAKIQIRRDTTTNWNTGSPTLAQGELGYDTTLNQLKIGTNLAATAWASLPWLTGTFPVFSSPASTDLNNAGNSVQGVYRFSSGSGLTNGPTAPIDIKAADGGVSMLVCTFGSIVLQQLWTDGDGTQPQKTYSRIFDTAWRSWIAQNTWGVSATEGVDILAKSLDIKDTASIAGIASFADGAVGTPAITNIGDTNTGIYFPAADELALVTAGTQALVVGSLQGVTCKANVQIDGTLDMTSGLISNVADPANAQDAVTRSYLEQGSNRVGISAIVTFNSSAVPQTELIGTAFDNSSPFSVFSNGSSGIANIRCTASQQWRGIVLYATGATEDCLVTSSACTRGNGSTALTAAAAAFSMDLMRTA
jgi:hypothetical protein